MHYLLDKLLNNRGIKSLEDLQPEEKAQFDEWNGILSGKDAVTVPKILEFCQSQKSLVEAQFANLDNSKERNDRLVLQHTIYSKLVRLIGADEAQRKALEKYLTQLIDTTPN